ncbi:MAG: hypothetical protein QF515_07550 [Pseudomonadales bacterium]|jgi:phospholipase/carboxylesterase|nr:hypothetical protein [Pseudomonadales bacterium]MDP6826952.1 hypothetical protein [Pseudomonadales bacterium]
MEQDTDGLLDAITALVSPLLTALDALAYAGRHLHPPDLQQVAGAVRQFREPLSVGLERFKAQEWPEHLQRFYSHCNEAAGHTLRAFDGLENSLADPSGVMVAYRAMGSSTRAIEVLYPVTSMLPPVSRFYVHEEYREDEELNEKLVAADPSREEVGVMHAANTSDERGGFSLYVPEYYDPDAACPLIVALHGGSGHGRSFVWTWLREARTRGAILLSPTSREGTWSLMGQDVDTPNLHRMVDHIKEHWNIDDERVLLTGMSDGGTFSYIAGLRERTPFTHLAPSSASFHPMLLEVVSPSRIKDLPIYLMHGALDWMFPVDVARTARDAFAAAGADLTYREIEDLSHTYPREENMRILDWLMGD